MSLTRMTRRVALIVSGLALLSCSCNYLFELPSNIVVKDNLMNIAQGGGSVQVMFSGITGQTIKITLTGRNTGMVPYAQLVAPNGGSSTVPAASPASNGVNTGQATLAQTGGYTLIVYDSAQVGGGVTIRVELV
jgi:hypothetical protein